MLKISAVYLIGKTEIPIHYTIWALVEQALLTVNNYFNQSKTAQKFQLVSYFIPNTLIIL
jgi:hypothetical protein